MTDLRFPESTSGTLDSTNLQPSDWCLLADRILADYADYDAWIVLHGTDSMAYTAGALPFLLSSFNKYGVPTSVLDKPVVITGSQVPLFFQETVDDPLTLRFNTDAYQNVCAAVAMTNTAVPEVSVAFRGRIFRGARVLKMNASEDDAFNSPNFPPLATIGINFTLDAPLVQPGPPTDDVALSNPAALARARERLAYIGARISECPVVPLESFPAVFSPDGSSAFLASIIDAVVAAGAKGLVLEGYGEGNFPSGDPDLPSEGAIARALSRATDAGVVIADATQVVAGVVDDAAYAAGAWLPAVGAVGIRDMTTICALTKLMVLLAEEGWSGNDWDENAVRRLLGQGLLGEAMVTDRLQARGRARLLPTQSLSALDDSARLVNDALEGVRLISAEGGTLWSPLPAEEVEVPCRLRAMGKTVLLTGRDGTHLWDAAAATGVSVPVSSLALRGSLLDDSFALVLTDPSGDAVATLYSAAGGA